MNIKGLSIQDIINLDPNQISRLNKKELAQVTSRLVSASNKRLRRTKPTNTGIVSPAVQQVAKQKGKSLDRFVRLNEELRQLQREKRIRTKQKRGTIRVTRKIEKIKEQIKKEIPQFSIKGKNRNQILSTFSDAKTFLSSETSTQEGFRQYREKIVDLLGRDITRSKDTENAFWTAYNRFMEEDNMREIFKSIGNQNDVLEWAREYIEDNSGVFDSDSLYKALQGELNREDIDNEFKFKSDVEGVPITFNDIDI